MQSRTIIKIRFTLDLHGKIATQKHSPRFVLQHDLLFSSSRSAGALLTSFSSYRPPLLLRVNLAVDFEPVRHLPRHLPHVAGVTACSRLRRVLKYTQKLARTLLRILWFKLVEPSSREHISNLFFLLPTLPLHPLFSCSSARFQLHCSRSFTSAKAEIGIYARSNFYLDGFILLTERN